MYLVPQRLEAPGLVGGITAGERSSLRGKAGGGETRLKQRKKQMQSDFIVTGALKKKKGIQITMNSVPMCTTI